MMLKLTEIRQWIASLGIAEDQHVYIGKLDNKQQKSIGVYGRSGSGSPGITTYDTKRLSLLVHWTTRKAESEVAAYELFEKLRNVSGLDIGDTHVAYLRLMVPEPQDVGTDDGGVYEYVIWLDLIYERK